MKYIAVRSLVLGLIISLLPSGAFAANTADIHSESNVRILDARGAGSIDLIHAAGRAGMTVERVQSVGISAPALDRLMDDDDDVVNVFLDVDGCTRWVGVST